LGGDSGGVMSSRIASNICLNCTRVLCAKVSCCPVRPRPVKKQIA
jgi:hypothetical protein